MNIIKKFKLLNFYKKVLKENKDILLREYNIHIDNVYRMYSVYHITEEEYKTYGEDNKIELKSTQANEFLNQITNSGNLLNANSLLNERANKNLARLDQFLLSKGLFEMYGLSDKSRYDKYNIKVVVEFKYINTARLENLKLFLLFSIIVGTLVSILLII